MTHREGLHEKKIVAREQQDFSAAEGSASWGNEIDLAASRSLGDRFSLLLKAAFFSADDPGFRDVSKIWVQLVANY